MIPFDVGAIPPFCALLDAQDHRVITVALEGLENILRAGVAANNSQILDHLIGKNCHDLALPLLLMSMVHFVDIYL